MAEIALGSAQFGLAYGVCNAGGKVAPDEIGEILRYAHSSGISMLDTAISYGNSESVLGRSGVDSWSIVSKLPALPDDERDVQKWAETHVAGSLQRLGKSKLYGLLLHRPTQLLGSRGNELYEVLRNIRESHLVDKIGVSVYAPSELDELMTKGLQFDLVQAPCNVIDNRLVASGWLSRLNDSGCEVQTRSAFLQGLLLMKLEDRPAMFDQWRNLWALFDRWLHDISMSPLEACLTHALSVPGVSHVVVGVQSIDHIKEVLTASAGEAAPVPKELQIDDPNLLNPACWGRA